LLRRCRQIAVLSHNFRRDHPNDKQYAQWHKNHIIQVAENRNEIWNQVDRRQGISGDNHGHRLCVPGDARITAREVQRMHIAFDHSRPISQTICHLFS